VGVRTAHFFDESRERPLTVEVWYPADIAAGKEELTVYENIPWHGLEEPVNFTGRALRDASAKGDKVPTVIYAHGAPGSRLQSLRLCEHLASHGFVVAAIDFTHMTYGDRDDQAYVSGLVDRPLDISFVLDELAGLEPFDRVADTAHAAILGYSFGGYAALAVCGAGLDFEQLKRHAKGPGEDNIGYVLGFRAWLEPKRGKQLGFQGDNRVKVAFVMAPWNMPALDLAQVRVPLFIAVSENDAVAPLARDAQFAFEHVSSAHVYKLVFEAGSHNLFTDPCLPETRQTDAAWEHCADPVWDKERAGDIVKHAALAFLRQFLLGKGEVSSTTFAGIPAVSFTDRAADG
jgi:predicted dienelactone hydrolase